MRLKLVILLFSYLLVSRPGCNDKNIQPEFPSGLSDAKKNSLAKQWKEGEVLFKTNCSGCHGIFTKGVDSIPNFSKVQIDNYGARFYAKDPKNHAIVRQLSPKDFAGIITFLTYLKKKGLAPVPPRTMK